MTWLKMWTEDLNPTFVHTSNAKGWIDLTIFSRGLSGANFAREILSREDGLTDHGMITFTIPMKQCSKIGVSRRNFKQVDMEDIFSKIMKRSEQQGHLGNWGKGWILQKILRPLSQALCKLLLCRFEKRCPTRPCVKNLLLGA